MKQDGWKFNTTRTIRKLAGGRSRRNNHDRVEGKEGREGELTRYLEGQEGSM